MADLGDVDIGGCGLKQWGIRVLVCWLIGQGFWLQRLRVERCRVGTCGLDRCRIEMCTVDTCRVNRCTAEMWRVDK